MCRPQQPARPIGFVQPSIFRDHRDGRHRKAAARIMFATSAAWMSFPLRPDREAILQSPGDECGEGARATAGVTTAAAESRVAQGAAADQYVEKITIIKDADAEGTPTAAAVRDKYRSRDSYSSSRDKGAGDDNVPDAASLLTRPPRRQSCARSRPITTCRSATPPHHGHYDYILLHGRSSKGTRGRGFHHLWQKCLCQGDGTGTLPPR